MAGLRYRLDPRGETLDLEAVAGLVREGRIDLGRRIEDSTGWRAPVADHPAVVDLLLREPETVQAPEFRQRHGEGQCLHCHRKGAGVYTRRRVLFLCRERAGLDFACPSCRARAIRSDLFATAWFGWSFRALSAMGEGLRLLTRPGDFAGLARGLSGLVLALSPFLVAGLIALLLFAPELAVPPEELARREMQEGTERYQRGEYEAAAALFERAAEHDPDGYEPPYYLSIALYQTGDYERALPPIRTASRLCGTVDARKRREILLRHARTARRAGETGEAIEVYREILASAPDDLAMHEEYQHALIEAGEFERAISEYRRRLEEKGERATADDHLLCARILLDPAEALAEIDRGLAIDPGHMPSLLESAGRLGQLGRWEESAERARASRERRDTAYSWSLEGFALAALGRRDEGVAVIESGVERFGKDLGLRRRLVDLELARGRIDAARRVIGETRGLAKGDAYEEALLDFDRALVEREAGEFEAARKGFAAVGVAKGVPDSLRADAWLETVLTELERGAIAEAVRLRDEARPFVEGDPSRRARLDLWVGVALVELEKRAEARALWGRALETAGTFAPEDDPTPLECLRFLAAGDFDSGNVAAFRARTWVARSPTLENNVEFVLALARLLAGDRAGFEAAVERSWGHNFPYFTARRWMERAQ